MWHVHLGKINVHNMEMVKIGKQLTTSHTEDKNALSWLANRI
jgi:hypothetical protein